MSTCLSQIYNDAKNGILSGFAKLELFPIWNLEKNSFVNLAYEAATVNIDDKVIEDTFYKEKYGITATSYNRDMQLFPILNNILKKIYNTEIYIVYIYYLNVCLLLLYLTYLLTYLLVTYSNSDTYTISIQYLYHISD